MSEPALIPLYGRMNGQNGQVVAYTTVDAADAAWLSRWRWNLHRAGSGYAFRSGWINGKVVGILMHRELLGLSHSDGREVDHINRNGLDNRRANLRVVSHAQNMQNLSLAKNNASGYRDVFWSAQKRKWIARVQLNRRKHFGGYFRDVHEAGQAAATLRQRLMTHAVEAV